MLDIKHLFHDTIVAHATGNSRSAIAVIRVSGARAFPIVEGIFKGKMDFENTSHLVRYGSIVSDQNIIDEVLVCPFKSPKSYTKENVVEISCHGSPIVVELIINLIVSVGARIAEPGEFTKRAFINGQLNLVQAEAISDLIESNSESARKLAISHLKSGISPKIFQIKSQIIHLLSYIELELDFSEESIEFADRNQLVELLIELQYECAELIESFQFGNAVKKGFPVTIAGKPNAGKSTLLNALLNEERAIVSSQAGTTRDVIEGSLFIEGYEFRISDTAGLRDSEDFIEQEGIRRSWDRINHAGIILGIFDSSIEDGKELENLILSNSKPDTNHLILIANKIDLISNTFEKRRYIGLGVSLKSKEGVKCVREELIKYVKKNYTPEQSVVSQIRHVKALEKCLEHAKNAHRELLSMNTPDIIALEIRISMQALGELTGEIFNEEILDNIFSKFCIGK